MSDTLIKCGLRAIKCIATCGNELKIPGSTLSICLANEKCDSQIGCEVLEYFGEHTKKIINDTIDLRRNGLTSPVEQPSVLLQDQLETCEQHCGMVPEKMDLQLDAIKAEREAEQCQK